MTSRGSSRISDAKQRAFDAKQKLAAAAVAGFVAVAWLAWSSHPGNSATATPSGDGSLHRRDTLLDDDGFDGFDSFGSIAPSGGVSPQVQTGVS
jgi:hypothetical protein